MTMRVTLSLGGWRSRADREYELRLPAISRFMWFWRGQHDFNDSRYVTYIFFGCEIKMTERFIGAAKESGDDDINLKDLATLASREDQKEIESLSVLITASVAVASCWVFGPAPSLGLVAVHAAHYLRRKWIAKLAWKREWDESVRKIEERTSQQFLEMSSADRAANARGRADLAAQIAEENLQ